MFIKTEKELVIYTRLSKKGKSHEYKRYRTIAILRCDCCGELFTRPRAKMSPQRLNNQYFHVCDTCDAKRFAQHKGAERRTIWNRPASSEDDISKL
jgi:formylmethanofuran dehydrogenase subunit E